MMIKMAHQPLLIDYEVDFLLNQWIKVCHKTEHFRPAKKFNWYSTRALFLVSEVYFGEKCW